MKTSLLPLQFLFRLSVALFICASTSVKAGGLLGDIVNVVVPGAGTTLDNAHRDIKNALPPYKVIEESASQSVNEVFVQSGAPALQELIARSRDDALRNGVQPIPHDIRQNLTGFIPDHVLNIARYRVQGGGDLTLQFNSIRYGEAHAITLDYVIVFKELNDALYNPTLWVHELTHVDQYQRWGIRDFSIRYLRNYDAVEREAYDSETRYMAWVALQNRRQQPSRGNPINTNVVNRPIAPFSSPQTSNICGTSAIACQLNEAAPVGTPCWCNTPLGSAIGSLVPSRVAAAPSNMSYASGFPSGYGMQVCGCWGQNPNPVAAESRCASGGVRLNICPGFCGPNYPRYAYVCQ